MGNVQTAQDGNAGDASVSGILGGSRPLLSSIIRAKAQADWNNRATETHDAKTIAGIQIGYDRAIDVIETAE